MSYSDSASDRLAAVRTAINNCLTAQSYTARNRGKVMAQLRDLRQLEKELMQEVQHESSGGMMASLGLQMRPQ